MLQTPLVLLLMLATSPVAQETEGTQPVPCLELELSTDAPGLELRAWWGRFDNSVYRIWARHDFLSNPAPATERASHDATLFAALLPEGPVHRGDVWNIDPDAFLPFLRQFHEGATSKLHHGWGARPGARGMLRSHNERFAEIALRAHLEFRIESETQTTWFTPAQFAGRLVLDRSDGSVHSFHLYVPPRDSNVDINVRGREAEGTMSFGIADIGFVPRMELFGGAPLPAAIGDSAVRWNCEVSEEVVDRTLAESFYAFAQIDWLPLPEALQQARASGKPLHVVTLFGSLDDESC